MQNNKVMREIETLKQDTTKVIRDLTVLTSALAGEGETGIKHAAESIQTATADELKKIRVRFGKLNQQMLTGVKKTEVQVKKNPYAWLAGAVGVGVLFLMLGTAKRVGD